MPGCASIRCGRVLAWCLYDWACSAFNTVVVTFVFATYFVHAVAKNAVIGTADWAAAQSVAGVIIAVIAAPLGAVADRGGHRRVILASLTAVMTLCTALLWFIHPHPADAVRALILVAIATIAYEAASVFYNALLPEVAPADQIGRVSGLAWGFGYLGGLTCLGLCLIVLVMPHPPLFGLASASAEPVRATALLAAGWIALFAWPVIVWTPAIARLPWRTALRQGLTALGWSLRAAAKNSAVTRFLIARMLYTDGLNTLFAFGAIFAAGTFGMDARATLLLGIALNITAALGAFLFSLVQDRLGDRIVVLIAIAALVVFGILVLLARSASAFWTFALPLGLFVGPAQSASRSLMARLAPATARNAFFGLYALSGRVTGFLGPMALGLITAATASQRAGMAVIVVLLVTGGLLLAATRTGATTG